MNTLNPLSINSAVMWGGGDEKTWAVDAASTRKCTCSRNLLRLLDAF